MIPASESLSRKFLLVVLVGAILLTVTVLNGQMPLPTINRTDQIAAGIFHSLALKHDGSLSAWGNNDNGQLDVPPPNSEFVAVAAGYFHSAAVKRDGVMVIWGSNAYGQTTISGENINFHRVAAGDYHTVGLRKDGTLVAWGRNDFQQCSVPAPNTGFQAVAAGASHTLALKDDGSIIAWGRNTDGQCNVPPPNTGFIAIAAGSYHSVGLKSDGTVVAWGRNAYGQCSVPVPNTGFVAISAGISHTLGLKSDGSIVGWGRNLYSVLQVPTPNSGFVSIATSDYHCVGMKQDGTVVSWGRNDKTQSDPPVGNADFLTPENARPLMNLSPLGLDFGTVTVGENRELQAEVSNVGGGLLAGEFLTTSGAFTVTGNRLLSLAPGASAVVTLLFTPKAQSAYHESGRFDGIDFHELPLTAVGIYPKPKVLAELEAFGADLNGPDAVFTVGTDYAISYQWFRNGQALQNGSRISGADGATLRISSPSSDDAGNYTCRITTGGGSVETMAAALTVAPNLPTA